jgi:hypothetical protein
MASQFTILLNRWFSRSSRLTRSNSRASSGLPSARFSCAGSIALAGDRDSEARVLCGVLRLLPSSLACVLGL